jgi:hypothetical protein
MVDEDEDAVADDGMDVAGDAAMLCTACGALYDVGVTSCQSRPCGSSQLRSVRRLQQRGEDIAGCLVCGARGSGTVRVFETGADASGAVITTSLYQNLPASHDPLDRERPGQGRRLLMFSDSRQAAAYFAPYVEDSYARLQRRRLLSQGLLSAGADRSPASVSDLVFETRRMAADVKNFKRRTTAQEQMREVAPWVMAEVLSTDDRQSLEGLGLVSITLDQDPAWRAPAPLLSLGLSEDEAWAFLQELLRTLRQQGAVTMPEEVPPNHEIFLPRLGPIFARQSGPEPIRKVLSWLPGRGTNRRIDYTSRVLRAVGSEADAGEILGGVWSFLTTPRTDIDWLASRTEEGLGAVHQIDHELLRFAWVTEESPCYRCSVCRRVSPVSLRGICPALACEGVLEEFAPPPREEEHYRSVYRSMHAVPLKALEHTAQWTNKEAATVQQEFIRGDVNALSCSTTFELGVDVGELQAVMLRNMPPTTANYLQRAGRAGRRSGAAALVVTYAQRRSHDLTRFSEPEVMMSGSIRAPYVPLDNVRIDRRHAHSIVLAAFFRWQFANTGRIYRTAGEFFLPADGGADAPVRLVAGFLDPVPDEVTESLRRVLPPSVHGPIGVDSGAWVAGLVDLLERVRLELAADVAELDSLRDEAAQAHKFQLAERYKRVGNTLRARDLLGFLANRNVVPKYGFPVDSVELRTGYSEAQHQVGTKLDLSRDLSQAIYEYAPDATLVAGGLLWTSRGIYRLPGRELQEFSYHVCRRCGGFRQAVADVDAHCQHCGEVAETAPRLLTVPEFGFVAGKKPVRPGARPPKASWSGAVHVLRQSEEAREHTAPMPGGKVQVRVGPRGRLIAIADGPGRAGYWICDWCGHGETAMGRPRKHDHLLKGKPCDGRSRRMDLAHTYETDLLTLDLKIPGVDLHQETMKSVLYAVLEAACETLEIARNDIGGALAPTGPTSWSLVLYDAVPGGAGHVLMVEAALKKVLAAALRRVTECDCGPETSCYGCLRSYGNQRDHEDLSRGSAADVLRRLLGGDARRTEATADPAWLLPAEWRAVYEHAMPEERSLLVELAGADLPRPSVGLESEEGIPLSVSWPGHRVAVRRELTDDEVIQLVAAGWTVVDPSLDQIAAALG